MKEKKKLKIILAGNPNVGKSTLFNTLTGAHQHTGNWTGKTVDTATGYCENDNFRFEITDLPGTYSLVPHSAEEEVARDCIAQGDYDGVIVVCDAICLERNLSLVLQVAEITPKIAVCVNLLDESEKRGVSVDIEKLSRLLGVSVTGTVAKKKKSAAQILEAAGKIYEKTVFPKQTVYPVFTELAISEVCEKLSAARWLGIKYLSGEITPKSAESAKVVEEVLEKWRKNAKSGENFQDVVAKTICGTAEEISRQVVCGNGNSGKRDRAADKILTGKITAFPVMLLLLACVFWLTVKGANYPSELLSKAAFALQGYLTALFEKMNAPDWLHGAVVLGVYRVLAWVVSVMLPPMAIFFPLFTLLEDVGYLPRIAYNLDAPFKKCGTCGKQALTMCMGFGCNAVGVTGCRIIDSPRERLLAVLTNSFVPCNGRFPTIISVLTVFFAVWGAETPVLLLVCFVLLGVLMTLGVTKLLSKTVLKGTPSSYILEMPPYRIPQVGKVIVRSVFDRTLFVLGRAVSVAAPAGLVIWLLANIAPDGVSLLSQCAEFLEPFAECIGLDGVILMAFILGLPANEIVIPIIIMVYTANGTITDGLSPNAMKDLFVQNGWTWVTAVNTAMFSLFHWPCSTTLITVKKETGSLKWTALAAALPTLTGIICCFVFTNICRILGI